MKVILNDSYMNLGEAGDVIDVKPGYARNFLIPQRIAVSATSANLRLFKDKEKEIAQKKETERKKSQTLQEALEGVKLTIKKKASDDGKLYGAVSARDVEEELKKLGNEVDRRMIVLGQQIKLVGDYEIMVKLVGGSKTHLPLTVMSDAVKQVEFEEEAPQAQEDAPETTEENTDS